MTPLETLAAFPNTPVMFEKEPDARALLACIDPGLEDYAKQESLLRAEPAIFILYPKVATHWLWIAWYDPKAYPGPNGGLSAAALPKASHTLEAANAWLADHLANHGDARFRSGRN